jgi:hypothetical protein
VTVSGGRVTLWVTLSGPATITVSISGRRGTFKLHGKRGRNKFKLRMRPLAAGHYKLTVVARDASGKRSKRYTISFTVPVRH